ncbi:hypothetical protein [Archangium sp.]|uniref:hypothetical protein n=1 Tax=Archangium sp. TaxID=1872627 RepID=UPI00286B3BEC|nr:hypothetical protein [Archangium sp.]
MARAWMKAGVGLLLWGSVCVGIAAWEATALTPQEPGTPEDGRSQQAEQRQCDATELATLETEARELVNAGGCTDVSQCRTAPVGARACGGPRDYVIYCAESTDEDALLRALDRLVRREERFNRQCGVFSICIFLSPPEIELVGDVCQAVTPPLDTLP